MTSVLLNSPGSAAVTRALLHFIWEGALIALALGLVLEVFRPRSARFRYAAACVAMLAMLGAFGWTIARSWPHASAPAPLPPVRLQLAPPPAFPSAPAPPNPGNRLRWLAPLWMTGVALFGARSVASWLAAQRFRRTGICAPSDYWQRKIVELSETIRLSRPVALLESCLTEVPVVVGWVRPVVLFPAGLLSGFPPEQVEYFLLHELAHVRRWDYLVNFIQSLAEDALFYHPAVWWVSAKIRAERENCCDDVVAELGHAPGFAAALAALEQRMSQNRNAARLPAMAVNGGRLMHRIQRLLGRPQAPRGAVAPALLAGALAISIAVAIGATQPQTASVASAFHALKPAPPPENPAPLLLAQATSDTPGVAGRPDPLQDPYRRWLDEEVVYIISPEERAAFLALGTDEERQHFIEQFWQRRDPTPGTPENEFRLEHYRRIAYANDNFASNSAPGWKTDRGMIYIKYGPPDEREEHPKGGAYERPLDQGGGIVTVYPFDKWLYRYIDGIGSNVHIEFVDPSGTGDYHMTTDPNEKNTAPVQPPAGPGGRGPVPRGPAAQAAAEQFRALQASAPPPSAAPKAAGPSADAPTPAPASRGETLFVFVRTRVAGTVTAVHVQNGQTVRRGQPLVDIDSGSDSPFNHILSPSDGVISNSTAQVGGRVEAGVWLMSIDATSTCSQGAAITVCYLGTAAAAPPAPQPQAAVAPAPAPTADSGFRRSRETGATIVFVAPRMSGTISRIFVRNYQTVQQGQLLLEIDSGGGSPINRILAPIGGIVSGAPDSVGRKVQPGQTIMTISSSTATAATPAQFEAQVKATMYQAGREAGDLCYSQGGTFASCNDQFQATSFGIAVKTMDLIVKKSGYEPTPEAQTALAALRKAVDDARNDRLRAR
jgi:GWxTD domain-containing protein